MKMSSTAVLYGMKSSKGEIDGRGFDSTTFNLSVDLGESTMGKSMGIVTRPFKFGKSEEFAKWEHLRKSWPVAGITCDCEFDVVAGAEGAVKLTLLGIKPAATQPKA